MEVEDLRMMDEEEAYLLEDHMKYNDDNDEEEVEDQDCQVEPTLQAVHLTEITQNSSNQVSSGDDDSTNTTAHNNTTGSSSTNNTGKVVLAAQAPGGRRRLFSIDISEDMNDNNGHGLNLTHIDSDYILDSLNPTLLLSEQSIDVNVRLPPLLSLSMNAPLPSSSSSNKRDRGFSFEFFSFHADEALDSNTTNTSATTANSCTGSNSFHYTRERGDSIIFDPMSFNDGGIHEESALRLAAVAQHTTSNATTSSTEPSPKLSGIVVPVVPTLPKIPDSMTSSSPSCNARKTSQSNHKATNWNGMNMPRLNSTPMVHKSSSSSTSSSSATTAKGTAQPLHLANHHVMSSSSISTQYNIANSSMNGNGNANSGRTINPLLVTSSHDHGHSHVNGIGNNGSNNVLDLSQLNFELINKGGRIGIYLPEARKERIAKFHRKRQNRIWRKRIKYDCRKKLADSRPRIKGRFVKRSEMSSNCNDHVGDSPEDIESGLVMDVTDGNDKMSTTIAVTLP